MTVGGLTTESQHGNGGAVTVSAADDVDVNVVASYVSGLDGGHGGSISLTSTGGAVGAPEWLHSYSHGLGGGGDVTVQADGSVWIGSEGIKTFSDNSSGGDGGSVSITSTSGSVGIPISAGIDLSSNWFISNWEVFFRGWKCANDLDLNCFIHRQLSKYL